MTARIPPTSEVVFVLHALRNVGAPISDGVARKGQQVFWKIAGADEPKRVSVTVTTPRTKK